jgi:hypothetical protein
MMPVHYKIFVLLYIIPITEKTALIDAVPDKKYLENIIPAGLFRRAIATFRQLG